MPPVVIIAGNGRSGSNRLLDALDCSPATICRSEADGVRGGDFHGIGAEHFEDDLSCEVLARLDRAIARAPTRRSARDRHDQTRKHFFTAAGPAVQRVLGRRRARAALGLLLPEFRAAEWSLPRFCHDAGRVAEATLVLKLAPPLWSVMLHDRRPDIRIVHNIRAPHGFLKSWYNRLVRDDVDRFFRKSLERNNRVRRLYGLDPIAPGDASVEAMCEAELWFWRYCNELLADRLEGSERYMRITYDAFSADREGVARQLFAFAGLGDDPDAVARAAAKPNVLFSRRHDLDLDRAMVDRVVRRVLDGSRLAALAG